MISKEKALSIRMLIMDVDGVLTDAGMYYSENGDELKKFSTYDGMAIHLLRKHNIKSAIITGENTRIVERRAAKLKIDYVYHGIKDKLPVALEICAKENISLHQVAYIGDDVNDLEVLQNVGLAACPANAMKAIKAIPGILQLEKNGGEGVVRELAEMILDYYPESLSGQRSKRKRNSMTNTKPALILTGGLGLIGSKTAEFLADRGFHIIVVDIAATSSFTNPGITYIPFDLSDISAYPKLVEKIKQHSDNLKGIINNAAFNPKVEDNSISTGRFEDLDLDNWNKEVNLNLTAPIFLVKALLPLFNHADGKNCKIVNVISTYGLVPPNQSIYRGLSELSGKEILKPINYPVTKAGLAMATRYLATYLGSKGFNVNGIAPGGIENHQPQVFIDAYSALTPQGRMAKVEEMLETFYLLCSDGSSYINGQIIAVDGGWTTW